VSLGNGVGCVRHRNATKGNNLHQVRGWRWIMLQKARKRPVHVDYPPRDRSPVKKLVPDDKQTRYGMSYDKIFFVTMGYYVKFNALKLEPRALRLWKRYKRKTPPIYERRMRFNIVRDALTRHITPALSIATAKYHHLLESFTMDEVLKIETMADDIRKAFDAEDARRAEQEACDAKSGHHDLGLKLSTLSNAFPQADAAPDRLLDEAGGSGGGVGRVFVPPAVPMQLVRGAGEQR